MTSSRISSRARPLFLAVVLVGTLLAASFPYLYGLAVRPAGSLYWAVPLINYLDANQYLALTRQAVDGQLLLGDPFTQQLHTPRLFLPEVLAEAALCRVLRVSPLIAFHVCRVLYGGLMLLASYWLGTLFLPRFRQQALFVGLLCFSAGASWYLEQLGLTWPNADLFQPEGNTFHTLSNLPHLSLAIGLLAALFASLAGLEADDHTPPTHRAKANALLALAFGCSFFLAWTHPFDLVTYTLGAGAYGLIRAIQDRSWPRQVLRHMGTVFLGAAPAALYLTWLVRRDPVYRALAQDISVVQEWRFYAVAHCFLIVPALALLFSAPARRRYLLPLCWIACVFLFLFTPFRMGGKQARLLGGVHVPLALLAAAGLDGITRRAFGRLSEPAKTAAAGSVCAAFLVVASTGVMGMLQRQTRDYAARQPDFYLSRNVQGLFRYLDQHGDRSQLTLGGAYTGGWAPVLADTRVYHGHWHMTLQEPQKRTERDWFFKTNDDPLRKAAWLRENGISWVICYPWEWPGAPTSLDTVPGLQPVYMTPDIWLYRFGG
jgi:hypothetical protein